MRKREGKVYPAVIALVQMQEGQVSGVDEDAVSDLEVFLEDSYAVFESEGHTATPLTLLLPDNDEAREVFRGWLADENSELRRYLRGQSSVEAVLSCETLQ